MKTAAVRMALLVTLASLVACSGGSNDPVADEPPPTEGPATDVGVDPDDLVGYRASLYPTHYPTERKNLNGSNTLRNVGLPRDARLEDLEIDRIDMPYPSLMYTRNRNEIFVFGGTSLIIENYVEQIDGQPTGDNVSAPYLAKLDPTTDELTTVPLDRGKGLPYLGGALVHEDGFVYVISQAHLYKFEPETMDIVESIELPVRDEGTVYNGLITSRTGELIVKGVSFQSGDAELLLIDGGTMEVTFRLPCDCATPRMALAVDDNDIEHLYHLNTEQTFRYIVEPGRLTLDPSWVADYAPDGPDVSEEPTSPVIFGDRVFYTTNTAPRASLPMRVFWQDVNATYGPDSPPLTGRLMFDDPANGAGWSFSGLASDEVNGVLLGNDQGRGLINAFTVDDGGLDLLWQHEANVSTAGGVVTDRQMVYVTDYVDGSNHLVVLDLMTGEELLRIPSPATRATIGTILLTPDNEVFLSCNEPGQTTGFLVRMRVAEPDGT